MRLRKKQTKKEKKTKASATGKKEKKKQQRRACRDEEKALVKTTPPGKEASTGGKKKNGNEMDADKRNIKRCTGPEHHQAVLSMDESPPSWWACDHLRKKLTHEQSPLMSAASTTRLVCSIR